MSDFESLAKELEQSEDHRVLRRFHVEDSYGNLTGEKVGSLAFLDFETTGLGDDKKAIEIGLIRVEYDMESGCLGRILERYNGFEDPGMPLTEEIIDLTGIKDSDVKGKTFDDAVVNEIVGRSTLLIAHNAIFDREVGERRFQSSMVDKPWACSVKDIPWKKFGISSSKLEFIASCLGYFYSGHRAVVDSEVTAGMVNVVLQNGHTGLWHLLQKARSPQFRVWAVNIRYNNPVSFRGRGYEWRDVPGRADKAWRIETPDYESEISFLKDHVFKNGGTILLEKIGNKNRFTSRRIESEWLEL